MNTVKKMRAGIMMFVFATLLVFTQSAFKSARAPQTWIFTGTSTAQITNPDFYAQSASQPTNCNTSSPLPCKLVLNDAIDTHEELDMFLDGKSNSQVLSYAVGRRN
jgi:hypothetical protein